MSEMTTTERIRALWYEIEQAKKAIGERTRDNLTVFAILDHAQASLAHFTDDYRSIYTQVPMVVTGWHTDYWPDYPDWVKDEAHV